MGQKREAESFLHLGSYATLDQVAAAVGHHEDERCIRRLITAKVTLDDTTAIPGALQPHGSDDTGAFDQSVFEEARLLGAAVDHQWAAVLELIRRAFELNALSKHSPLRVINGGVVVWSDLPHHIRADPLVLDLEHNGHAL